jgi:hypothetical protein
MNSRILTALLVLLWNNPAHAWRIESVSSLNKLTATNAGVLEPYKCEPVRLRAARGEWECFQVVVAADDVTLGEVTVTASELRSRRGKALAGAKLQLYWENYVLVDKPSGNRRLEPLRWPDALIPTSLQPKTIEARRAGVLWAALFVPPDAQPGAYTATLQVGAGGAIKKLPITLAVEPVTMPAPSLRGNVAVYYDTLRDWYAKNSERPDDARFAQLKRAYYEFLLDYRLNAYDLPVGWGSDEADAYLRDPRVLSVRVPPLDSAEFTPAVQRLKRLGLLSKGYYYWIDEPAPERYEEVSSTTAKLHAVDPELRHCVTTHPNNALVNSVDIWCPNIGDFFGLGHLDTAMLQA